MSIKLRWTIKNADFNADKAKQYQAVRKILAAKYAEKFHLVSEIERFAREKTKRPTRRDVRMRRQKFAKAILESKRK